MQPTDWFMLESELERGKNGIGSVAPSSVNLRLDCALVKCIYLCINRLKNTNKMKISTRNKPFHSAGFQPLPS